MLEIPDDYVIMSGKQVGKRKQMCEIKNVMDEEIIHEQSNRCALKLTMGVDEFDNGQLTFGIVEEKFLGLQFRTLHIPKFMADLFSCKDHSFEVMMENPLLPIIAIFVMESMDNTRRYKYATVCVPELFGYNKFLHIRQENWSNFSNGGEFIAWCIDDLEHITDHHFNSICKREVFANDDNYLGWRSGVIDDLKYNILKRIVNRSDEYSLHNCVKHISRIKRDGLGEEVHSLVYEVILDGFDSFKFDVGIIRYFVDERREKWRVVFEASEFFKNVLIMKNSDRSTREYFLGLVVYMSATVQNLVNTSFFVELDVPYLKGRYDVHSTMYHRPDGRPLGVTCNVYPLQNNQPDPTSVLSYTLFLGHDGFDHRQYFTFFKLVCECLLDGYGKLQSATHYWMHVRNTSCMPTKEAIEQSYNDYKNRKTPWQLLKNWWNR